MKIICLEGDPFFIWKQGISSNMFNDIFLFSKAFRTELHQSWTKQTPTKGLKLWYLSRHFSWHPLRFSHFTHFFFFYILLCVS